MKEIWKDIKDYEGLYQVSNLGRVKSLVRKLNDGRLWKEMILKQEINQGYARVLLSNNKNKKHKRVHRLVAEAFIPNPNNYPIINHKDENRLNNRVDNLEWCTWKYNSNYGDCNLKIGKKLSKSVAQYDLNGNLIKKYDSISDVSRKTGYNISYLSNCCNDKYEKAYNYKWKYINEGE